MTPRWVVTKAAVPGTIWARYATAVGLKELQNVFGVNWPPEDARPLEEVYVWRDQNLSPRPFDPTDHPACWLSLSRDQFNDKEVHMSRGVWPDQHGKGLGKLMREFAENYCRERGCDMLSIDIAAVNAQHLTNAIADPYWEMIGVTFNPPVFEFTHEVV